MGDYWQILKEADWRYSKALDDNDECALRALDEKYRKMKIKAHQATFDLIVYDVWMEKGHE